MNKEHYRKIQEELAQQVLVLPDTTAIQLAATAIIFTFDIQYTETLGYVAVDIQEWGGQHLGVYVKKYPVVEIYQPSFFAFREGPLLLQAFEEVMAETKLHPQLLIIDGHGTAHPRQLGVASWLGIKCGVPSIGVAKKALLKQVYMLGEQAGSQVAVYLEEQIVGYVLRTQDGIKPVFVSVGTGLSQQQAVEIVMALRGNYRIIEPIRRADQAARQYAKTRLR